MGLPTEGETFAKLMEHLRLAQEAAAMMSHLRAAQDDRGNANQWLVVSENFRKMQQAVTSLATRKMN